MSKADKFRLHDYLQHILEAILRIDEYTDDMIECTFVDNKLVQDAVIRNLEIVGEACRNIERDYPEFQKKYPDLPLGIAYEMRNALAHGYFAVDLEIVWRTVENDLPLLKKQVQTIYEQVK